MKKYMKYIVVLVIIICMISLIILAQNNGKRGEESDFKIVTSFYPLYIMTANIVEGAKDVELTNMTDVNSGCIHDYTLLASDMKKIENANVFIQNGLGLESFMDKIVNNKKELTLVDTSKNIEDLIQENDIINPHIWTSISNYILQVQNISKVLKEKNPENAQVYEKNTNKYIERLNNLKENYDKNLQELKGQAAVCLNESFEYLAKDMGLKLKLVHTSHEESAISAKEIKDVIEWVKANNAKIIIVDINDDLKNAQVISNETGAKIYKLDSALTGNMDKESYIRSMNGNIDVLKNEE